MYRIEKLTEEQFGQMAVIRDRWIAHGLSCEPANRAEAERGFRMAYESAGLTCPDQIVWCGSPLSAITLMMTKSAKQESVNELVYDLVRNSVWHLFWNLMEKHVQDSVVNIIQQSFFHPVSTSVYDSVQNRVWNSIWNKNQGSIRDQIQGHIFDSIFGQHNADFFAFCDCWSLIANVPYADAIAGLAHAAKNCGWWFPYRDLIVACERTLVIKKDDQGACHCEDGPAIAFRDGFEIYLRHGVTVPKRWIMDKGNIDIAQELSHGNIERRTALTQIVGWDRIINELNATIIDVDSDPFVGELLAVNLPHNEQMKILRALCGTGRVVTILAAPEARTAREANAMSYDIAPDEFHAGVRT